MLKIGKLMSLLLLLLLSTQVAEAQIVRNKPKKEKKEKTEKYFDEKGGFKHRLWYGGSLNLNFGQATQFVNVFQFGVSPMVGYKVTERFSVGPRVSLDYLYYKGTTINNTRASKNTFNYSMGAFARFKVFQGFFAHVEYAYETNQFILTDINGLLGVDQFNNVLTQSVSQNNFYPGIGYNSGGLFAMDIMLLYNYRVGQDVNTSRLPFDYRIGFTYKF
jgi:hypothetical protein